MAKASTKRLFTPQLIERLSPEKGRRVEIMDSNCPGLVLRVTEGGVRTFGVLYRVAGKGGVGGRGKPLMGPQQRFTLGKYPRIGLKQARERARAIIDEASERPRELPRRPMVAPWESTVTVREPPPMTLSLLASDLSLCLKNAAADFSVV